MKQIIHMEDNIISISVTENETTIQKESHIFHIENHHDDERIGLLVRAFNNRTRQYNFFKLYSDMLDGTITEEEYDRELDQNEDRYVLPEPVEATLSQIELAYDLSKNMSGIDSTEDFTSIFSISDGSIQNLITR